MRREYVRSAGRLVRKWIFVLSHFFVFHHFAFTCCFCDDFSSKMTERSEFSPLKVDLGGRDHWRGPGFCGTGMDELEFYAFHMALVRCCRGSRRVHYDPEVSLYCFAGEYPVRLMTGGLSVSYPVGSPEWVCRYIWRRHHLELHIWELLQVEALIDQLEVQGPSDGLSIDDGISSGVEGLGPEERDKLLR